MKLNNQQKGSTSNTSGSIPSMSIYSMSDGVSTTTLFRERRFKLKEPELLTKYQVRRYIEIHIWLFDCLSMQFSLCKKDMCIFVCVSVCSVFCHIHRNGYLNRGVFKQK